MQSYEDAVLKVVMWWSDKSFRTNMNQSNGDKTGSTGIVVNAMLNLASLRANLDVDAEKIKKFESKLTELLSNAGLRDRMLSVDYDPCEMLYKATEFAGISPSCLPVKSHTRINEQNEAFAKYQYGGPEVKL